MENEFDDFASKVFEKFDIGKTGFIDKNEILTVCSELGKPLTPNE